MTFEQGVGRVVIVAALLLVLFFGGRAVLHSMGIDSISVGVTVNGTGVVPGGDIWAIPRIRQ